MTRCFFGSRLSKNARASAFGFLKYAAPGNVPIRIVLAFPEMILDGSNRFVGIPADGLACRGPIDLFEVAPSDRARAYAEFEVLQEDPA